MNTASRTISGTFLIVAGLVLIVLAPIAQFITLIYGIPFLILGFVILLNKSEDAIEQRKDLRTRSDVKKLGGKKLGRDEW